MNQSLGMGAYAGYLFMAYGVTAVVIIGNIIAARRRFHLTQKRLREQLDRRAVRSVPGRAPKESRGSAAVGRGS